MLTFTVEKLMLPCWTGTTVKNFW